MIIGRYPNWPLTQGNWTADGSGRIARGPITAEYCLVAEKISVIMDCSRKRRAAVTCGIADIKSVFASDRVPEVDAHHDKLA